jgi:zinc transport system ATP-binding protein
MLLNRYMIAFGHPKDILQEEYLRRTFGHLGHEHEMYMGEKK